MNSIDLNHALMTRRINALAILLLVIGNVLSVALFLYSQQLSNKTEALQMDMQQLTHTDNQMLTPSRRTSSLNAKKDVAQVVAQDDEVVAVNAAIKQIVLPWTALFKALESVNTADVKLLALEPNAQQRTVQITAIALSTDSMMRYVETLNQQKMLKDVVLVSQESVDIAGDTSGKKATQFVIEALWKI